LLFLNKETKLNQTCVSQMIRMKHFCIMKQRVRIL